MSIPKASGSRRLRLAAISMHWPCVCISTCTFISTILCSLELAKVLAKVVSHEESQFSSTPGHCNVHEIQEEGRVQLFFSCTGHWLKGEDVIDCIASLRCFVLRSAAEAQHCIASVPLKPGTYRFDKNARIKKENNRSRLIILKLYNVRFCLTHKSGFADSTLISASKFYSMYVWVTVFKYSIVMDSMHASIILYTW